MDIRFVPGSDRISKNVDPPLTSKSFIPDWYKKINGKKENVNVKKCVPFLDSFISGYIQSTWADIYVEIKNNNLNVYHDGNIPLFQKRKEISIPISNEYYPIEFIWQRPWSIDLPDGFSALITHPLNRVDLNFFTLSGIVDSDKYSHSPIGNIPFFIKNNFTGIIPKGTPMFQIIPIKREDWESKVDDFKETLWIEKINEKLNSESFYKNKAWQRKKYD